MFGRKAFALKLAEVGPQIALETLLAIVVSDILTGLAAALLLGFRSEGTLDVVTFWKIALAISTLVTACVTPVFAAVMAIAMRDLRAARDELARIAQSDPLTGLLNRRGFDAAAERAGAARQPIAALMCDIDWFKAINDQHGHAFGDEALKRVADVLRRSLIGHACVLGRHGGEEFAVLLLGPDAHAAADVAETIRSACESTIFEHDDRSARITLSIGFAASAGEAEPRAVFARADAALYQAKREGRNRVVAASGFRAREVVAAGSESSHFMSRASIHPVSGGTQ